MNPTLLVLAAIAGWVLLLWGLLALVGAAGRSRRFDDAFDADTDTESEPDGEVFASDFDTATDEAVGLAPPLLTTQLTDKQVDAAFAEIRAAWLEGSK